MICSNCNKENKDGSTFCSFCGSKLINNIPSTNDSAINNANYQNVKKPFSNKKELITFGLIAVVLIAILSILFIPGKSRSRTIMMYIVGSNLESDAGIVTSELKSIDASKIDLTNTNVVIYTGGTKSWKNDFISNEENAIFELTSQGFKKVKTYSKENMGDAKTLSEFINYVYNNYKTGKYDLVFYDHGGALDGAVYDDFSLDNLSLSDFKTAMESSPFNKSNKLEAILFRTCLNGTLEVANLFSPYSEYIVFSEEISYGRGDENVLSFVNNLTLEDTGREFGYKFLDSYKRQMEHIDSFGTAGVTYSVVDLSKIDKVISELNKFTNGIDIKTNYNEISKVRASMYQYGNTSKTYDTVDLYSFVSKLSKYSSVDSKDLLDAINEAVIRNYTNLEESKGLSIYFPYNGKNSRVKYLNVYKGLDFADNYFSFIRSFYTAQNESKSNAFSFDKNEMVADSNDEITMQLTKDQHDKLSYAKYIVFKRNEEHPNYYQPIYISDDPVVSDDGVISTQIKNNLIYVKDKNHLLNITHTKNGSYETFTTGAILYDKTLDVFDKAYNRSVDLYFDLKGSDVKPASAKVRYDADERVEGTLLDLDIYNYMETYLFIYKIFDDKGNFTLDFESSPEHTGVGGSLDELNFGKTSLKEVDGEFYVAFVLWDTNGERYNSNLMKVGN